VQEDKRDLFTLTMRESQKMIEGGLILSLRQKLALGSRSAGHHRRDRIHNITRITALGQSIDVIPPGKLPSVSPARR